MSAETLECVTLHKGRVFTLVREKVALQNGVTINLDIVRHPGAAAMVPLTEQNSLLMIRQYRHATGGFIWEIPAGTLDPEEAPLDCARRELIEEIGYSDERIHIFCAMDLSPARQRLDRDEILEVHEVPFDEAVRMVERGEIGDAKTLSGLFMARLWLKQGLL
jgi:ADP-ribose pyrophosphatase